MRAALPETYACGNWDALSRPGGGYYAEGHQVKIRFAEAVRKQWADDRVRVRNVRHGYLLLCNGALSVVDRPAPAAFLATWCFHLPKERTPDPWLQPSLRNKLPRRQSQLETSLRALLR